MDYVFGFSTVEQAKLWFNDEDRSALADLGCKVVAYRVAKNHVLVGDHQVAFKKSKAKKLETLTVAPNQI